jgi:hypothetical protein
MPRRPEVDFRTVFLPVRVAYRWIREQRGSNFSQLKSIASRSLTHHSKFLRKSRPGGHQPGIIGNQRGAFP